MDEFRALHDLIRGCSRCPLRATATAPVPGFGPTNSEIMIIGEAPGRNEDEEGIPFIGAAGHRLQQLLKRADISVNKCFLANTCRCRPPENRVPRKSEVNSCKQWLFREITLLRPKIIITLGATPLALFTNHPLAQVHGTMFDSNTPGFPVRVVAMYHPAAAFRRPRLWAVMLNDWEFFPAVVPAEYKVVPPQVPLPYPVAVDTENDPSGTIGEWSIAYRKDGQLMVEPHAGRETTYYWGNGEVVMHNAKWDLRVLSRNGMQRPTNVHDTMIAAYCLGLGQQASQDSAKEDAGNEMVGGLGLKYLARRNLGMAMKSWDEVRDHPEQIREYNFADSVATYLLWEKWRPQLPEHYWKIDMPLLPVLMKMEDRGIAIDQSYLTEFERELRQQLTTYDFPLNPNSVDDLRSYVYGTLGVEPWKFTKKGAPSVSADVLRSVGDPLLNDIVRYKALEKDLETYVDDYIVQSKVDGRIHPEFKQTGTATGRLSARNPNLQNVPKKGDRGDAMRRLFVAKPGHKLVRMDYNQLELRVFAAIAQEQRMLAAFQRGEDIHEATSRELNVDRRSAKINNFLTLFGGTEYKIALEFGINIDQAREFQQHYYAKFPGVKTYIDNQKRLAKEEREVANYFGRKRRLDAMFAPDWRVRSEGEREAINTPVQGTAGEIVKIAMIELDKRNANLLLQIHDELIFEVPENEARDYSRWLWEYVPTITSVNGSYFPVSVGYGNNWLEASTDIKF